MMNFTQLIALHIPDGFLSIPVALLGWLMMIALLGLALQKTRDQLGERQVPLLGVLSAFVFAAQMINFPVAGGTSGHLLGGALVAIIISPWAAILVMASVVIIQALLFQDGGILALGFNVVNMGILTAFVGYGVYQAWQKFLPYSWLGAAIGAWFSVEAAALATAFQLVLSGTSSAQVVFPAMIGVHALIGIGEALITVGALSFIRQARPDLLANPNPDRSYMWVSAGLFIALAIAFVSPFASSSPDGLERVAEDQAFLDKAKDAPFEILPDYTIPIISNEALSTILAGIIGIFIVAGLSYWVGRNNKTDDTRTLPSR